MGDREERPDERDAEDGGHNKIGSRNVDEEAEHDERGGRATTARTAL